MEALVTSAVRGDVKPVYTAPPPSEAKHSLADLVRARAELDYDPAVQLRDELLRRIQPFRVEELQPEPEPLVGAYGR
jgi:hypothetical protein